jgi:dolichol-phosphate mannosyltransferase
MLVSVVLPTYNERENIVKLIEHLTEVLEGGHPYEIVVVDDASPDGTAEAVEGRFGSSDVVRLIRRNGQRGLATAVRRGLEESRGEVIILMDADFSHRPQDLPVLLTVADRFDLVNGSRYLPTGGFQGSLRARVSSWLINRFLRSLLHLKTTDSTSGFLAIRRSLLSQLSAESIFYGYGDFHFRLLVDAGRHSASIGEVPVVHQFRRGGRAKTRLFRDGWGYVWSAIKIRLGVERLGEKGRRP